MKASELRIGNYIQISGSNKAIKVNSIDFDPHIGDDYYYINGFEHKNILSIPLTEEWLLQFGFKFDGSRYNYTTRYNWELPLYNAMPGIFKWNPNGYDYVNIEYVHQLQNLIFALTNEELIPTP